MNVPSSESIAKALTFWEGIARENGWRVGTLQVWYDPTDGTVTDSVAVKTDSDAPAQILLLQDDAS